MILVEDHGAYEQQNKENNEMTTETESLEYLRTKLKNKISDIQEITKQICKLEEELKKAKKDKCEIFIKLSENHWKKENYK